MTWTVTTLGSASGFLDAVLAPNGSIYAPSYTNSAAYLRIDPDDSVHLIGTRPAPLYKWAGAGIVGDTVVGVPNSDGDTLLIDTTTETTSIAGGVSAGAWAYMFAASVDGAVWSAPGNASSLYRSDGDSTHYNAGTLAGGYDRWSGPVDCGDGTLICFSRASSASSLIVDTTTFAAGDGYATSTVNQEGAVAGPAHTDGYAEITIASTGTPTYFSVVGRVNTSGHRYQASIRPSGYVEVYRYNGSWSGVIASSPSTWPGAGHTLGLGIVGTTITIYFDGVAVGSGTDSGIGTSGRWGMEAGVVTGVEISEYATTGDGGSFSHDFTTDTPAPNLGPAWTKYSGSGTPAWAIEADATITTSAGPTMRAENGVRLGGRVYGAPNGAGMPIYDVSTQSLISTDTTYIYGYSSGCDTGDGRVLFAPRSASSALIYDPATATFETVPVAAGYTQAVRRGTDIYLIPYSAANVVKLSPARAGFRNLGLTRGARSVT